MARRFAMAVLCFGWGVLSIVADAAPGPARESVGPRQNAPAVPSGLLDLASFLPRAGEATGWSPKGKPLVYKGEDLFTYIDGGADIYMEYGFRQVVVQDYEEASRETLTVEVFEMADAAAAFGMFTFKTSARGSEAPLGQGGRLEDYYLNFWKGPVLVTVTGFDESPESVGGVRAVAEAVDRKLQVQGKKPALAAAFPPEWAARGGLKYLRGPLGLRNQHPVFARQAIRFHEGVCGRPADGVLAVVLRGRTVSETRDALADAEKAFSSSRASSGYQNRGARFEARDSRGHVIEGRLLDGALGLLVSKGPAEGAKKMWERLRAALSGKSASPGNRDQGDARVGPGHADFSSLPPVGGQFVRQFPDKGKEKEASRCAK